MSLLLIAALEALGDLDAETRKTAFQALRAEGKAALPELIELLDSRSPLLRREAARLIAAIADDLASRPIPEPPPAPKRQLPESVGELLLALESQESDWRRRIEAELDRRRAEALPLLLTALESQATTHPERLLRLLGEWGDLSAVGPLLKSWDDLPSGTPRLTLLDALKKLARVLAQNPEALSEADLLRFVAFARKEMPLADAAPLGDALCRRATLHPTPALRLLLPYLKGSWLHPIPESFTSARLAIQHAIRTSADLPTPAAPPDEGENLPRPAESATTMTNLPRPSEEKP